MIDFLMLQKWIENTQNNVDITLEIRNSMRRTNDKLVFGELRRIMYRLIDNDKDGAIEMMREYQESLYYHGDVACYNAPISCKDREQFFDWLEQKNAKN